MTALNKTKFILFHVPRKTDCQVHRTILRQVSNLDFNFNHFNVKFRSQNIEQKIDCIAVL